MKVIAVDLGGSYIKSGVFDDGVLTSIGSAPTEAVSRESILAALCRVLDGLVEGAEGIALSCAGDIDAYRGVCLYATPNLPGFTGLDLKALIETRYGLRTAVINDGHAALLGEAAKCELTRPAAMLTLGTGVGGAYYDGRDVVFGADFRFGRFGHLPLGHEGRVCNCGRTDCIEQYVSATALARACARIGTTPEAVFAADDALGRAVAARYVDDLAAACEVVYRAAPYEVMIFGGGVCGSANLWLPMLRKRTARPVYAGILGNRAGMTGAYEWWRRHA